VPALDDPGQLRIFPCLPLSEYLFESLEQARFHKFTLATNPCRLSFLGKEIVICRFNYLKKIKQNQLQKIVSQQ